jgi:hypothetical protein
MTRYEAFIEKSWRESGLTQLLVARIRGDGRADIGFFLVDLWCLGIKDAFLHDDATEAEFTELITERLPEEYRERLHPACAKKMIDGAIAYAERLGFAPHRDYRKARRALGGLDTSGCPETFTFGRDGQPFYVEGPHDTPERTERVLAMLEARCGADGFGCKLVGDEDDQLEEARDELRFFFERLEDDAPDFYQFAGMVAALHVCPALVPPTQLLARLFGPAGHTWRDADEAKDFADDLGVYWNDIAELIAACAAAPLDDAEANPLDIFEDDFDEPDPATKVDYLTMALITWAGGFMRATHEWPDAWGDALTRADLAPYWQVVRAWADPKKPEHLSLLRGEEKSDESARKTSDLPFAIRALLRALRPPGLPAAP